MKRYELEELAHLYASEGLEGEALSAFEEWKSTASEEDKGRFGEMVDAVARVTLAAVPEVEPSPALKKKLLEQAEAESRKLPASLGELGEFAYLRSREGEWVQLPVPGARVKELSARREDGVALFLLELDPGTKFPAHRHKGAEMAYVLTGDLHTEDEVLHAGDFMRAAPGSKHHHLYSEKGCQALLVTAFENYPRRSIGLLGRLARVYKRARSLVLKEKED